MENGNYIQMLGIANRMYALHREAMNTLRERVERAFDDTDFSVMSIYFTNPGDMVTNVTIRPGAVTVSTRGGRYPMIEVHSLEEIADLDSHEVPREVLFYYETLAELAMRIVQSPKSESDGPPCSNV